MPLQTRKLGSGDLVVPVGCLGTMTFGEQVSEEQAYAQLDYALERGMNFIDTAEVYPVPQQNGTSGATEEYIGRWLASRKCREKVIIATKVSGPALPTGLASMDRSHITAARRDPPVNDGTQPQLTAVQIKEACDASLRRMQTTYIDLYQIHWPARYKPMWGARQYRIEREKRAGVPSIDEQVQAMGDLIQAGKIRHWGISNESAVGVLLFFQAARRLGVPPPITIQNDFSLVGRFFEEETAEACAPSNANVSLLAYGALAGGFLSGKYHDSDAPPPERSRHVLFPNFQARYHTERSKQAAAEYIRLAKSKDLTPTQLAYAWAASRWYMGSVIIGATTMEQLKEGIDALEIELDQDTLKQVDEIHLRLRNPNATD